MVKTEKSAPGMANGAESKKTEERVAEIELAETLFETVPNSTPTIRYRLTAKSDAGRLVLWLSERAAKQLEELILNRPLRSEEKRPQAGSPETASAAGESD